MKITKMNQLVKFTKGLIFLGKNNKMFMKMREYTSTQIKNIKG